LNKTIPEEKDFSEGKISRKGLLVELAKEREKLTTAISRLDRRGSRVDKAPERAVNQAYVTFHAHAAKHAAIRKHKVTLMRWLRPDSAVVLKVHR
jgi:hypothetical protein